MSSVELEGEKKRLVEDMRVAQSEKGARLGVCIMQFILILPVRTKDETCLIVITVQLSRLSGPHTMGYRKNTFPLNKVSFLPKNS